MLTILRTPTCINYRTIANALTYLPPKGLRKVFAVVPQRWVEDVSRWNSTLVQAVDENQAVQNLSLRSVSLALDLLGFGGGVGGKHERFQGRTSPGWYLVQLINLGFALREDVLDTLLVHDADQMILPSFEVYGSGTFADPESGRKRPKFAVRTGGLIIHHYDSAYTCLTGERMAYHAPSTRDAARSSRHPVPRTRWIEHAHEGSFVTHSYVIFRPFLRELLAAFTKSVRRAAPQQAVPLAGSTGTPLADWADSIIRCINPAAPLLGFSEISSYISHVLAHHPEAAYIEQSVSWARNPPAHAWARVRGADGFCCSFDGALSAAARGGLQFLGAELGHPPPSAHDSGDSARLACHKDYVERGEFFLSTPYPPASNPFWSERGVSFHVTQQPHAGRDAQRMQPLASSAPGAVVFAMLALGGLAGSGLLANVIDSLGRIGEYRGDALMVTDELECAEATALAARGSTSTGGAMGGASSRGWRRVRPRVWERDGLSLHLVVVARPPSAFRAKMHKARLWEHARAAGLQPAFLVYLDIDIVVALPVGPFLRFMRESGGGGPHAMLFFRNVFGGSEPWHGGLFVSYAGSGEECMRRWGAAMETHAMRAPAHQPMDLLRDQEALATINCDGGIGTLPGDAMQPIKATSLRGDGRVHRASRTGGIFMHFTRNDVLSARPMAMPGRIERDIVVAFFERLHLPEGPYSSRVCPATGPRRNVSFELRGRGCCRPRSAASDHLTGTFATRVDAMVSAAGCEEACQRDPECDAFEVNANGRPTDGGCFEPPGAAHCTAHCYLFRIRSSELTVRCQNGRAHERMTCFGRVAETLS